MHRAQSSSCKTGTLDGYGVWDDPVIKPTFRPFRGDQKSRICHGPACVSSSSLISASVRHPCGRVAAVGGPGQDIMLAAEANVAIGGWDKAWWERLTMKSEGQPIYS